MTHDRRISIPGSTSRWLAWGMAAVAAVFTVVGLGYAVASWHVPLPADTFAFRGFNAIIALEFAATGLILALKRPGNRFVGSSSPGAGTTLHGRVPVAATPPDTVPVPPKA